MKYRAVYENGTRVVWNGMPIETPHEHELRTIKRLAGRHALTVRKAVKVVRDDGEVVGAYPAELGEPPPV